MNFPDRYSLIRQVLKLRDVQKKRKVLPTLEALDGYFSYVEEEEKKYGDAALDLLDQVRLAPPTDYPQDPFSPEYAQFQMKLYHRLAGSSAYHAAQAEQNPLDIKKLRDMPFPYFTQNPRRVADHLLAQSHLIRHGAPEPGSRIVEFGPGWGGLSFKLARMGYEVTLVEICPNMCEFLEYRSKQLNQKVTIIQGGMLEFVPKESYEAAIFFESFHHCQDHLRLLHQVRNMLTDSGRILFGSEPITYFPMPWGVRLDGLSLWAIRRHGWLELGFDHQYFRKALLKSGFGYVFHQDRKYHIAKCVVANKI